ncbi:MAG: alkaline phosphatase family protein [Opitutales bacterium]|nr:alkaline phosphatase family protein [Opitutales bacterium]
MNSASRLPTLRPVLTVLACIAVWVPATSAAAEGRATVFLISLDGMRADYFERADTPFFDELAAAGAYSMETTGVFPSVTFSSHVSIATGTKAEVHGITANSFYDARTRRLHRYAGDQALLEAEPFWTTATRQGVRTIVLDWVNAHNQTGPHTSAYFGESYTRGISDEERIARVVDTWERDDHDEPLRFVLAYAESPDKEGHRAGPVSDLVDRRMEEMDTLMRQTTDRVRTLWERIAGPDDTLYVIITSDHGMAPVEYHVDLRKGSEIDERVRAVATSALVHFFFDAIEDPDERGEIKATVQRDLAELEPITVHTRDSMPAEWRYNHPYRTGDIVATVPVPYAFFRHNGEEMIQPASVTGRFFGAHGYDPRTHPEMNTVLFMQRWPEPLGGTDLGEISLLQIHATVCALLGIDPAPTARTDAFFEP